MSLPSVARSLSALNEHRLHLYSTAAVAAGVSMLALTPSSEAKVVITRKNIQIHVGHLLSIDLNHDGISDLQFSFRSEADACVSYGSLFMQMAPGAAAIGGPIGFASGPYASALVRGAKIGPSAHFVGTGNIVRIENDFFEYCSGSDEARENGNWGGNPPNRYVGVKFLIHGTTHYGWIRLSVDFPLHIGSPRSATITAYAYETIANKIIVAGNTSSSTTDGVSEQRPKSFEPSLGMLALGADGLPLWRREGTLTSK
jgi:hypothetical protein